jgi:hypothetical protein
MAKWFGKIGYEIITQTEPGIWAAGDIVEREYYGDITSDHWRRQNSGEINDNVTLSNVVSIIPDQFAYENCSNMAYVEIMGAKWKISDIEIQNPRLILTVGGVYNG